MIELLSDSNAWTALLTLTALQIAILDVVFSPDPVLTAVAMAPGMIEVMILALAFLILVGMTLVSAGFHHHIERGLIYAAIAFPAGRETLNLIAAGRRKRAAAAERCEGV